MDWLIALSQIALTALVLLLLLVGYQIRDALKTIEGILIKYRPTPHHHHHTALTNYSTWTYRKDKWELVESRIETGFEAGDPPRRPGAYEGETVRRPAVRSS